MIGIADPARAEADLGAGALGCPRCGGPRQPPVTPGPHRPRPGQGHGVSAAAAGSLLGPSGHARAAVRDGRAPAGGDHRGDRRGPGRQRGWGRLPAHRLCNWTGRCRPCGAGSARRWVRAARAPGHPGWLRAQAIDWIARVDREVLTELEAAGSTRLGEALRALATAAVVLRARVLPQPPPWTLIGQITHGRLVAPTAPA